MRRHVTLAIVLIGVCWGGMLAAPAGAPATAHGPLSVAQARSALAKAHAAYLEAQRVYAATRTYSARYGSPVGRWSRDALLAGWPTGQLDKLLGIVRRESMGQPRCVEPSSYASGLLQFLPFWWNGSGDLHWRFDPLDPYQNLRHGYLAWRRLGWAPWAL